MSSAAATDQRRRVADVVFRDEIRAAPVGYAKIVWRYENATISSSSAMTALTGVESNAAAPQSSTRAPSADAARRSPLRRQRHHRRGRTDARDQRVQWK
jgi:hypothetical protein